MKITLQVEPPGLVAAAERLDAAAAQLARPGVPVHPPLATDQTSVAAAARLSAAAGELQSAAVTQAAALVATADQLRATAARFIEQETVNAATVRTLTSASQPVESPHPLAPVPPVLADARPPLPPPLGADGEMVARQLWAGSASAGTDFTQSWRWRAAEAAAAHDVVRDVAATLPERWDSPLGTAAAASRLLHQADAIDAVAARAEALADQADGHARGYRDAVTNTPKPSEFDAVQVQLDQALEANARFPGRYTPLVSSLIAKQGELRQQALNTQSQYHEQSETGTDPGQAPQPGMVPGLLGAVGGMAGGVLAAAMQVPQALMQSGQQLVQAAAQGLSGLSTSTSEAGGIASATTGFGTHPDTAGVSTVPTDSGATTPAGATDTTPVSPSTSSAPPLTTSLPLGGVSLGTVPAAGPAAMPMGMPLGMMAPAPAAGQHIGADKKIVVPVVPHTESVTGKTAPERLATSPDSVP